MIERERIDLTGMKCMASFSDCEKYRYNLRWIYDADKPLIYAWMLNPSTADHETLDPTCGGMLKRARAWGYGGISVINIFAYRATSPLDMKAAQDPIGPENDARITQELHAAAKSNAPVIAGWGNHGLHNGRQANCLDIAKKAQTKLQAFEINARGTPKHPLYVKHDLRPKLWQDI